ncbi:MAG: hypothetical protein WAU75_01710 [Solirubrobacteraceae bacterium]
MKLGAPAASSADGVPALHDQALVRARWIAPVRFLGLSELAFSDLYEFVIWLHSSRS